MPWTFYNASGQKLSSAATSINVLDIDGATDIGEDIANGDLLIIDNGAGGTNRRTTVDRIKTYVGPGAQVTMLETDSAATSDTTLSDQAPFAVTVGANENWHIRMVLHFTIYTAGDLKWTFTAPTSCTAEMFSRMWLRTGGETDESWGATPGTGIALIASSNNEYAVVIDAIFENEGNAGTIQFQWAQNSSSGSATTLHDVSVMEAWKQT